MDVRYHGRKHILMARQKEEREVHNEEKKKKKKWILTLETREPVNKLSALLVLVFLRRY